jgi:hypothetical protein
MESTKPVENRIDDTLDDSFPASDPPSWNLGREHKPPAITPPLPAKRRGRGKSRQYGGRGERS